MAETTEDKILELKKLERALSRQHLIQESYKGSLGMKRLVKQLAEKGMVTKKSLTYEKKKKKKKKKEIFDRTFKMVLFFAICSNSHNRSSSNSLAPLLTPFFPKGTGYEATHKHSYFLKSRYSPNQNHQIIH